MTGADANTSVRVRVSGRVQGVWFRGWTAQRAEALGLSGWVRNRQDGTVEAVFAGPSAAVTQMVEDCQVGPPAARVREVRTEPADWPPDSGFTAD